MLILELTSHRWGPWLHANLTGDRQLLDGPVGKRCAVQREHDEAIGGRKGQVVVPCIPAAQAPSQTAGVPLQSMRNCLYSRLPG